MTEIEFNLKAIAILRQLVTGKTNPAQLSEKVFKMEERMDATQDVVIFSNLSDKRDLIETALKLYDVLQPEQF